MRRACPHCGSFETVIVNNRRNKLLIVVDWLLYLPAALIALAIGLGDFRPPDIDILPIKRKCRGCGEIFVRGKARGRDRRRCRRCDYDLTGNTSGICPECGTEVKDA